MKLRTCSELTALTRDEEHEVDGPGGDKVDDGTDVKAQSLEQKCLADVVFTRGLDFI